MSVCREEDLLGCFDWRRSLDLIQGEVTPARVPSEEEVEPGHTKPSEEVEVG